MDAVQPEETLMKNIAATSPQIHKALNNTAIRGDRSPANTAAIGEAVLQWAALEII